MAEQTATFLGLLFGALVMGSMFAVWQLFRPGDVGAAEYLLLQQRAIRAFNGLLPALGLSTIVMILISCWLSRDEANRLWLLLGAALCFVVAGFITRFLNQPINAKIVTWTIDTLPADWTDLRDSWWHWHTIRLSAGAGGFVLLIAAALLGRR